MKTLTPEKLAEMFPKIFKDKNAIQIGGGWCALLIEPLKYIQSTIDNNISSHPQIVILQAKEKFGTMRIYSMLDLPEGKKWEDYKNMEWSINGLKGVLDYVAHLSYNVCEITGDKGFLCTSENGWMRTLSEEKIKELNYTKLEAYEE